MSEATCRYCKAPLEITLVDLGETPLANSFVTPGEEAAERRWPLHVRVCSACWLAQVDTDAPADEIFSHDYAYLSSYSPGWVAHAKRYAEAMTERFGIGAESLVVEIASNDGYLLQHFVGMGVPVLGIEPAGHAASLAREKGVPSEVMFFHEGTARELAARGVKADLMAANNVLAHVPDIGAFAAGFPLVLAPEGVLTFEFPHLLNLMREVQFDTIYHEHYSYLSLLAVERILGGAGLRVFDVEKLPTHGGSLRVFLCHQGAAHAESPAVGALRVEEGAAGLATAEAYADFAAKVAEVKRGFLAFLAEAKAAGKRIAGYGAAAKGNTFLNYCGVGRDDLVCVADRNPEKQDKLLPGAHVPVVSPEAMLAEKPDYVLILPWNLREEIAEQLAEVRDWGGQFVTAIPDVRVF